MQGNALRGTAENHDRCCLALHFSALGRRLEQRARPEERDGIACHIQRAGVVGLLEFLGSAAAHRLHHVGGHPDSQAAAANHHHLGHRGGQWQHQFELGAFACNRGCLNPATDAVDF